MKKKQNQDGHEIKGRPTSIDLTGKRFGKLVAVDFSHYSNNNRQYWNFICDCGNKAVIGKTGIIRKNKPTRSCGCLSKNFYRDITGQSFNGITAVKKTGKNNHNCWIWEFKCFCGETFEHEANDITSNKVRSCGCRTNNIMTNTSNDAHGILSVVYSQIENSASKRNLDFSLTKEEVTKLVLSNCFYCDQRPSQIKKGHKSEMKTNGIDRVNNLEGYHIDNCVSACFPCNQAKHRMSVIGFKEFIERIIAFKNTKQGFWE